MGERESISNSLLSFWVLFQRAYNVSRFSQLFCTPVKHTNQSLQLSVSEIHQSIIHFPPPLPVWRTNNDFIDFGIESLLSLAISERFREKLGFEVHSSFFHDFSSIGVDDHSLSFEIEKVEMNCYLILNQGNTESMTTLRAVEGCT